MNLIESKRCPYCNELLDRVPKQKRVCEKCNNVYYVRTRPSDYKRVVVTEEEKELIELHISATSGH